MKIVAFTGAGISRESGLRTFRDSEDGLWNGYDVMEVCSTEGWRADPAKVLDFYNMRRLEAKEAVPNDAHRALAELEARHDVTVITQNIDDLHERAGSNQVIHVHGEVFRVRPVDRDRAAEWQTWTGDLVLGDQDARGVQLRPAIVWFGEPLPLIDRAMGLALAEDVDVLIVVGTSLNVYPAALIATESRAREIIVVDPSPPRMAGRVRFVPQSATDGVRRVVDELLAR